MHIAGVLLSLLGGLALGAGALLLLLPSKRQEGVSLLMIGVLSLGFVMYSAGTSEEAEAAKGSATTARDTEAANISGEEVEPRELADLRSLYEELQSFKDDPEFHRFGFAPCCRYKIWLARVNKLLDSLDPPRFLQIMHRISFAPTDIRDLGMAYMRRDQFSIRQIGTLEPAVRKGLFRSGAKP